MRLNRLARLMVFGLAILCLSSTPHAAEGDWQRTDTSLAWRVGSDVVWRFSFDPAAGKPFFDPVAPVGGPSLTNFKPEDHPWHYGLWFSVEVHQRRELLGRESDDRPSGRGHPVDDANDHDRAGWPGHHRHGCDLHTSVGPGRHARDAAPDGFRTGRQRRLHHRLALDICRGAGGAELGRTPMPGEPNGAINGGYAGLGVRLPSAPLAMSVVTPDGPVTEFVGNRARPNASAVGCNFAEGGTTVAALAIPERPGQYR